MPSFSSRRAHAFGRKSSLLGFVVLCLTLAGCSITRLSEAQTPDDQAAIATQPTAVEPSPTATPRPTATPTPQPTPTPTYLSPSEAPEITLDAIFNGRNLDELQLDPKRVRTIMATGDIIPGRRVDAAIRERNNDYLYPIQATKDILRNADLTVINLESPLIEACPDSYPRFTFCGQAGFVDALVEAEIDVATLENNHIGDYGRAGIEETIRRLEDAGIAWASRSTPAIKEIRGLTFGFLAYNSVIEPLDRDLMEREIRALRPRVDVLIVAAHWGAEYVALPEPAPSTLQDPLEIAHQIIDAGADLIIGNHPHWLQAVEIYNGKLITYAHGNFIFDQMFSYETRLSVIGRYTFYDEKLIGVEFIPTIVENYAQPVPLKGDEAQNVLDDMRDASERWRRVLAGEEPRPYGQSAY